MQLPAVRTAGVAAGALEIQLPNRVAYVYSIQQLPTVAKPPQYNTYLRHFMVDGRPITVQVSKQHCRLPTPLEAEASKRQMLASLCMQLPYNADNMH